MSKQNLSESKDGSKEEVDHSTPQGIVASFNCRTVRIGSYCYTPKEKVYISSKGIKLVAPSLKDESRAVALQIQIKEVISILIHFGKGLPVIFLYTMTKCGLYVRKALDMTDESGAYFNPISKMNPNKRITILPEFISDDAKTALKTLFGKVLQELNSKEANDILVRTGIDLKFLRTKDGETVTNKMGMSMSKRSRSTSTSGLEKKTGRPTPVCSKEPRRPVQRVPPVKTQRHVSAASSDSMGPLAAKMLIFLENGEQRLITFTLPKESCTLQEVLEQVNVPFSEDTHIQCMQNTSGPIDYFVSVGSTTRIEELLEGHPMFVGNLSSSSSSSSEVHTPEKSSTGPETGAHGSPASPRPRSPPPRFVEGQLALCKTCGYTGTDFNRCQRCKRIFTEEPKSVPVLTNKKAEKKKEPREIPL